MTNLNYLRYFYTCAQFGTFTQAAVKLGLSQPSLSIQIKSFEEQLGFHLFIRTGRSIQLTPKGQDLFLYATKIFEVTDDMEKFLKKNVPSSPYSLKIGVSDEVERPFVAEIVGQLVKTESAKKLAPSILSMKHRDIVMQVVNEEVDLVITNEKASELKLVNTLKIPVMLVTGNLIPVSRVSQHNLHNVFKMLEQNLILPTKEMILAEETKKFLKSENFVIPTALTSNIIACLIRAVQEKLGASFLPISYVQRELKSGHLRAFGPKEGYWQHHLYLYTYKRNNNHFVSSISNILQNFGALKFDSQAFDNQRL
ncbi:MAG: LysR family transcriptional regulator [Bdellovibrionaceae bacterium]|nr:LysR family transcriptional regulator [Pseudobdellovibrionaceae bacterium]